MGWGALLSFKVCAKKKDHNRQETSEVGVFRGGGGSGGMRRWWAPSKGPLKQLRLVTQHWLQV